jgi:hypothetical protein
VPCWSGYDSRTWLYQSGKTVYQIKHGRLSQYMIEQLRNPSVRIALA